MRAASRQMEQAGLHYTHPLHHQSATGTPANGTGMARQFSHLLHSVSTCCAPERDAHVATCVFACIVDAGWCRTCVHLTGFGVMGPLTVLLPQLQQQYLGSIQTAAGLVAWEHSTGPTPPAHAPAPCCTLAAPDPDRSPQTEPVPCPGVCRSCVVPAGALCVNRHAPAAWYTLASFSSLSALVPTTQLLTSLLLGTQASARDWNLAWYVTGRSASPPASIARVSCKRLCCPCVVCMAWQCGADMLWRTSAPDPCAQAPQLLTTMSRDL